MKLELAWTKYKSTTISNQLILILGIQGGKTYGILAERVPDKEITLIKQNKTLLEGFDLSARLTWLKRHTPMTYSKSLRTYQTSNLELLKVYPIKP